MFDGVMVHAVDWAAMGEGRFRERLLQPRRAIRGLYLTGQDISVCGLAGALAGAYVTASAIVGRPLFPRTPKQAGVSSQRSPVIQ
jgi:hypothetical protein